MSYKEQKAKWLKSHPKATADEAYEEGYKQAISNWCSHKR